MKRSKDYRESYSTVPGSPTFWLSFWFILNTSLTIYNKAVMQFYEFNYAWFLTGIHMAFAFLGCSILASLGVFHPGTLRSNKILAIFAFSFLVTLNMAVSNISLNLVTVPFHQTVRSTVPFLTMIIMSFLGRKRYSSAVGLTMLPIVVGVCLATFGDYSYTTLGFIMTLLGAFLSALKGIVTHFMQIGSYPIHPLDLILREMKAMRYALEDREDHLSLIFVLCINGLMAFFLNVASFVANQKTSALSMSVAGNVKQVATICLSFLFFHLHIVFLNTAGILLTLFGGLAYSLVLERERNLRLRKHLPI